MKLVRYSDASKVRLGVIKGDGVIDLSNRVAGVSESMIALIADWDRLRPRVAELTAKATADAPLASVRLLAPIARPGKIFAIGLNYADHIKESGQPTPQYQTWFTKAATSINGPYDPIELPLASKMTDYEAELVVIISRRCKHVPKERAAEVVFGYTCGNDVSVRDWQMRSGQWVLGKSFDTHAPIGPWIITADELGDPHTLGIRCIVNGEMRQNSNTANLVFGVFDQIAHLTQAMTLEPGDVLFTGTPGGVGAAAKPPRWLQAGDVVRVEIDRIGAIEASMCPEAGG
jgi:2-keto-4-pentenoate hydratase/2-oxohepta-3-ene-1,7-dioic acid hydratase in catechol pathway